MESEENKTRPSLDTTIKNPSKACRENMYCSAVSIEQSWPLYRGWPDYTVQFLQNSLHWDTASIGRYTEGGLIIQCSSYRTVFSGDGHWCYSESDSIIQCSVHVPNHIQRSGLTVAVSTEHSSLSLYKLHAVFPTQLHSEPGKAQTQFCLHICLHNTPSQLGMP